MKNAYEVEIFLLFHTVIGAMNKRLSCQFHFLQVFPLAPLLEHANFSASQGLLLKYLSLSPLPVTLFSAQPRGQPLSDTLPPAGA